MSEENISTINKKIWNMADVLRDDGVSNIDYLEQITYLLFLKMCDEYSKPPFNKDMKIPENCKWETLTNKKGAELAKHYKEVLETLGEQEGILKEIYGSAQNKINTPAMLVRVINLIDKETWTAFSTDVKGAIYEGLLEKTSSDIKSGAGQYFTPRPLINAMVKCIAPEPNKNICDPCCGSGGFLISSKNFIEDNHVLDEKQKSFLKYETFRGWEIVPTTYKMSLMNLFLHNISDFGGKSPITRADSLLSDPGERFDYVLTNPPFGTKSTITFTNEEGEQEKEDTVYNRQDFWCASSNKQFNFLQHIHTILKTNGKCAVVMPDNILFEEGSGGLTIRKKLLETTNLHTILRLPTGIFYKPGVKANVLFFDNKVASPEIQTKEIWYYDFRAGQHFTLKQHPLGESDLDEFVELYCSNNIQNRKETWSNENPDGKWRKFTYEEIEKNNFNLDIKWIDDTENVDEIEIIDIFQKIKDENDHINSIVNRLKNVLLADKIEDIDDNIQPIKEYSKTKSHCEKLLTYSEMLKKKIIKELINDFNNEEYEETELGKLLIYEQPTKYTVNSTKYNDNYKTPVLTAGKTFLLGYTNETTGIFDKEKLPVIIFDDFTTASKFVNFEFKVKSSAMKILHINEGNNPKYLYYLLQTINIDSSTHKRYWISEFSNYKVIVPSLEEQNRIVNKIECSLKLLENI